MSGRLVVAIVTTLIYELALAALVIWVLPRVGVTVPVPALAVMMLALGAWAVVTYRKGSKALSMRETPGLSSMVGTTGKAVSSLDPEGTVKIKGELWNAVSAEGRIDAEEEVIVVARVKLRLRVIRLNNQDPAKIRRKNIKWAAKFRPGKLNQSRRL